MNDRARWNGHWSARPNPHFVDRRCMAWLAPRMGVHVRRIDARPVMAWGATLVRFFYEAKHRKDDPAAEGWGCKHVRSTALMVSSPDGQRGVVACRWRWCGECGALGSEGHWTMPRMKFARVVYQSPKEGGA